MSKNNQKNKLTIVKGVGPTESVIVSGKNLSFLLKDYLSTNNPIITRNKEKIIFSLLKTKEPFTDKNNVEIVKNVFEVYLN